MEKKRLERCFPRESMVKIVRRMKLLTLLLMLAFAASAANSYSQQTRFNLRLNNVTVRDVFLQIEENSEFILLYNEKFVDVNRHVDVQVKDETVESILAQVFQGTENSWKIYDRQIVILAPNETQVPSIVRSENSQPQERQVSGTVKDSNGLPLPGVSVIVKGTTTGIVTDLDGKFSLTIPATAQVLTFSFVGMKPQEVPAAGKNIFNVVMEEENIGIEEVIAVGYGTMKKSDLTGAVASVKADQLNTIPASNAMEALAGKVAGVNIGVVTKPGSSPSVLIRGRRSVNAGNSPLYVVDGIPRGTIEDIPVSEIQSIEVLKDAVSASIYGARGANGVILVTTKSGKLNQEKTTIDFDTYYGINSIKLPDLMEGDEYMVYRRHRAHFDAYGGKGWATGAPLNDDQTFDAKELDAAQRRIFTDWKKLLYKQQTASQEHNLNITTSGTKTWGRFSVGYRNDDGYYPNSGAKRLSLGLKMDQQVFDFLKLGVNARFTNRVVDDVDPGRMQSSGTVTYNSLTYLNPLIRAYDDEGNLIENVINIYANPLLDFQNPYIDRLTQQRLFTVFTLSADLFDGMTFNSNFGYEFNNRLGDIFYGKNTTKRYIVRDSEGAYAEKNHSLGTDMTWDNILGYSKTFGKHNLNATAVFSLQKSVSKYFEARGTGLPDDALGNWNLSELQNNIRNESSYRQETMASGIGRVQYGYDDRYLFNVSIRSDGASVLAPGNKWATFPAASVAWVLSKEDFYRSNVLTTLKFRFSYGTVGNAAISPYETYASTQAKRTNFGETFLTGYMLDGLVNKGLGWEISRTANFGTDWALFKGRISGYIDAYRTYTTDLLFKRSLPHLSGSTEIWQNIGETSNTGIEVMINSINIEKNNFRWQTDFNFSTNRGKIEKLITTEDMPDNNLFIGKPLQVYYNYILDGIWQVEEAEEAKKYGTYPGYQKLRDIAGPDGPGADGSVSSTFDRVILGQQDPKRMYYLRNSFSYKNLTFSFAFDGKFGHLIQMSGTGWSSSLPLKILNDYWTPDNPNGKYPLMALSTTGTLDGLWRYRKGDYINMQEISLGYRFKIPGINNLGISLQARNPFYLYRAATDCVDPASPSSDWTTWKSYALKLDVKF